MMSDSLPGGGLAPIRVALEIRKFIDEHRIEAALPQPYRRQAQGKSHYERIGGLTNRNYKITIGGETLVLRLPGRGTARFINRAMECANQDAAAQAGFTPKSLFFDERTGVKLSEFLNDAVALDADAAKSPAMSESVARFLAQYHSSELRFGNEFNVFHMAHVYERIARTRRAKFYSGYRELRLRAFSLEGALASLGAPKVACHNDLVPENILVTPRGLTLIDWEYSGMNDPAWDLAAFLLESGYDERLKESFLSWYAPDGASRGLRARIAAYACLQDFLWALWSLLQETASLDQAKAKYYRSYGHFRFLRCVESIGEVESTLGAIVAACHEQGGEKT